jgi:50S ribosomal protein L16 3-hydroxylase
MEFRNFDMGRFLAESWQKKPLLIRNPWACWSNPLAPDELAGFACIDEVESRLIRQSADNLVLEHGPLPEERFSQLDREPWTLLVQAVDHHIPAVAALLNAFRFIPDWRIDDVMVSYAVEGGGVGPHFDQYDVFLIQGLGRRRWQIGGPCDHATALLPHDDLRLLADFQPTDEWILEPGDILYVPPRFAHNGVAVSDDCMTYSIGFRAPSRGELIAAWSEYLVAKLHDDDRYADPDLAAQKNSGELSSEAIGRLHAMVAEKALDKGAFATWFGQYNTLPKNADMDWQADEPTDPGHVRLLAARQVPLLRNPASRFAFIREGTQNVSLFVDGKRFACSGEVAAFAELLCTQSQFMVSPQLLALEPVMDLIVALLDQGSLAFDLED